ncbi:MAG TPA: peptide chain release factor N(5)-glutamine methyltransferase [Gemmataceae bacterium]|jgi:release factor glutamine methyltransferase|nr:peptide chain release factor N(5)-glutamine methyltransferase [Gemmataceae bacterium]
MDTKVSRPPDTEQPWTIGGLLDWTARFLAQKGSEFPRLDTEVLLAHAVGCRRIELYTRYEEIASTEARGRFRELVRRRMEGCPVAYLVGRKEFFALEFEVSPAVLIPRPESEFVVMECLRLAKELAGPRILDIGTGTGNIAVAVARQHPGAQLTAVDLSPEALAVAQRNAARHGVAERMRFLLGDLFGPIPAGERFDFLLSNPPYIAREHVGGLPPGVRDYEPHLALDGGPGGYAVLDRLLLRAAEYLEPGGHLILEIGAAQEEAARQRITARGGYELFPTIHDYSGHARVLRACLRR